MKKILDNIKLFPAADSFLSCVKGCYDYYGIDLSYEDIHGLTGYAFRIYIHENISPAGPQHSRWEKLFPEAFAQTGYKCYNYQYFNWNKDPAEFEKKQQSHITLICEALDKGLPVISYGYGLPEFCIISGYDSERKEFFVKTVMQPDSGQFVSWDLLGKETVPTLSVTFPTRKLDDWDLKSSFLSSLSLALRHYSGNDWSQKPLINTGLSAYDSWISAFTKSPRDIANRVIKEGNAYCALFYAQARAAAAEYLQKHCGLLDEKSSILEDASQSLLMEAGIFFELTQMYQFPECGKFTDSSIKKTAELLTNAKLQYERAMKQIRKAVSGP